MRVLPRLLASLGVGVLALGLVLGALEVALRLFPRLLPAGSYGASRYDPELLTTVHGSPVVYNKLRLVVREPNAEGFLDVAHERARPAGTLRVGFFGDSYVEAAQVPLEQVFFRRLSLGARRRLEPFGFGISGWGTLHALLAYRVLAPRYDLDAAVYLFVENDPGDNDLHVQGARTGRLSPKTFATLSPLAPGFELVLLNPPERLGAGLRFAKWCQERLVLGRLLWSRLALLLRRGIALPGDTGRAQREMASRASAVPDQNDLPSSWPPAYRERAAALGERILREWRDRARSDGRRLAVLYVPRGEAQLRGEIALRDTWQPWLVSVTRELGLPLLDPSDALRRRMNEGVAVYDDHWSPAGHEVIAAELSRWLARELL